ncbi:hypothetical protein GGS23DRAFT_159173 [Durotheca rogersii]|uniref:uncharacterized protein n=1 Tax=Durotheca rogersii TaxID=419775 RepID=UPI00221FFCBD|nr:uncharacterized protein GGS23DRAFT_159173 [Durotheca rogersii]KAI5861239.1 hypothetical protein GGS23DRAFT_159173 [Durotheca rogersii]
MSRVTKTATAGEVQINMDDGDKQKDLLHDLELKHQSNTSETELLNKDEDIRRLRVRILTLRDENTSLGDQIAQNNDANAQLAAQCDDLGAQIDAKMDVIRSQEKQLQKQEREYANLKAELEAMNGATQQSSNLLSEKLSLARELAVLKPEIEHLRSQVNHQQATLTEKLALERQVDTLEAELANEKKATKRAMQKRESNDRVEDELRKKLRDAERSLAAEKAARERVEDQLEQEKRTHQFALQEQDSTREQEADLRKKLHDAQRQLREEKENKERLEEELQAAKLSAKKLQKSQASRSADDELRDQLEALRINLESQEKANAKIRTETHVAVSEADTRNDQLEKKMERLKAKLRETRDQLKQCQEELRKAQSRSSALDDVTKTLGRPQALHKRKPLDMATDDFTYIEIQTPGADDTTRARRALKKRVFEPTLVGEKSAFSITPFLNRTRSIMEDTPKTDDGAPSTEAAAAAAPPVEAAGSPTPEPATAQQGEASEPALPGAEAPAPRPPAVKARGRPKKVLSDAPSAKKNSQPAARKRTVKAKAAELEKVAEEEGSGAGSHEGGEAEAEAAAPRREKSASAAPPDKAATVKFNFDLPLDAAAGGEPQPPQQKKKKRKVLGAAKTLFDDDDDDEDEARDDGEAPLPPARKPAKVQLGAKRAPGKAPAAGAQRSAFAGGLSFSPLKKDRRGVGASFLA